MATKGTRKKAVLQPVLRDDGRWGWHLLSRGAVVATDGAQGYERPSTALRMARQIVGGAYDVTERGADPLRS